MKCRECDCCHEVILNRWSSDNQCWTKETVYQCWGVKEPFVIADINQECSEYEHKRRESPKEANIKSTIDHFKYGVSHDIFKEPVTSYAKMAIEALEKQLPKQPLVWEYKYYYSSTPNDDWGYECPCCGNRDIDYPEHHCICGQALDWSD